MGKRVRISPATAKQKKWAWAKIRHERTFWAEGDASFVFIFAPPRNPTYISQPQPISLLWVLPCKREHLCICVTNLIVLLPAKGKLMWEREKRVELTISFSPVFLLFPALGNAWGSGGLSSLWLNNIDFPKNNQENYFYCTKLIIDVLTRHVATCHN